MEKVQLRIMELKAERERERERERVRDSTGDKKKGRGTQKNRSERMREYMSSAQSRYSNIERNHA
jgi:hypothetical protein